MAYFSLGSSSSTDYWVRNTQGCFLKCSSPRPPGTSVKCFSVIHPEVLKLNLWDTSPIRYPRKWLGYFLFSVLLLFSLDLLVPIIEKAMTVIYSLLTLFIITNDPSVLLRIWWAQWQEFTTLFSYCFNFCRIQMYEKMVTFRSNVICFLSVTCSSSE